MEARRDGQRFETLIVLDFEATCDNQAPPSPQEIIEFPSVLLSMADLSVVDEFSAFVRPTHPNRQRRAA